ncbi:MAG: hypothetical protein QW350_01580 [Candidatus Aenigmatarchaeota archaeon]|nr:hypothetical protein [Candidatus Aenigmarchaeota archaeon]
MFCKHRKGTGGLLIIAIFFLVVIVLFGIFISFFRYNIIISEIENIKEDRESLLFLSIINKEYSFGNFVVSMSNDTEKTIKEIESYIEEFNSIEKNKISSIPERKSIYYYYNFNGKDNTIYYISNHKCLAKPMKCTKYTYINKVPIPKIYDGKEFISEGIFISFV